VNYAYLDSSAIVKLMRVEPETSALETVLAHLDGVVTSSLSVVEITRAVRRVGNRKLLQRVEDIIDSLVLIDLNGGIVASAGGVAPPELRSLDAIHLATAISLDFQDGELEFITYDQRLAAAARKAGLTVSAPR
jgi:predicted nucleic acid-binding protein